MSLGGHGKAENENFVEPNNQQSVNEPLRPELPAEKKKSYRSALLKLRAQLVETDSNFKDPENEDKHPWAYSPGEQQMILNCHKDFQKTLKDPSRSVKTTADALKVSRNTVYCVVRGGNVRRANRIKNRERFSKVDSFTKDLIRATIYEFYDQKICPTLDMLFEKIQERTKGKDYEFP